MHSCRSKSKRVESRHGIAGKSSGRTSSKGKGPAVSPGTSKIIAARFLHEQFFRNHCPDIMEIIAHYHLATIMFCSTTINLDLVSAFFANLHWVSDDPLLYRTRVGKRDIDFSPDIWRSFLACRPAKNAFVCYPNLPQPLVAPFENLTIDLMFEHFFHRPRPLHITRYSSQGLSAPDNILYKVIVGCLLPLVTRGQAYVRFSHLFFMYALRHRLDVDIGLNMFHCIVHFTKPRKGKIHMPFPHLITAWLASLGIDVARDGANLKPLTDYDRIGLRNCSLAGMKEGFRTMQWADGHNYHIEELGAAEAEGAEGAEADEEADSDDDEPAEGMPHYFEAAFESVDTRIEELRVEMISRYDARFDSIDGTVSQLATSVDQLTTMFHSWMSSHPPPPPPSTSGGGSASGEHPPMDLD